MPAKFPVNSNSLGIIIRDGIRLLKQKGYGTVISIGSNFYCILQRKKQMNC